MRIRAVLFASAVATLAMSAGPASGATLFTTAAHTSRVTAGATASMALSGTYALTSSGATLLTCSSSTLAITVSQNTSALVNATVTSGTWAGCSFTPNRTFTWALTLRSNATTSGTSTVWPNATVDEFHSDLLGGFYFGTTDSTHVLRRASAPVGSTPPTTGVYWRQPTAAAAPACMVLERAGTIVGPLITNGQLDATYCLEGTAAGWSLT